MAKAEWGLKRLCPNCGTRYYDFNKRPVLCPVCGTEFDPETLLKSRRGRTVIEEPKRAAKAPAAAEPDSDADDTGAVTDDIETEDADAGIAAGTSVEDDAEEDEPLSAPTADDDAESEEEESFIEDTSELGDDGEDMADVVIEEDEEPE